MKIKVLEFLNLRLYNEEKRKECTIEFNKIV